MNSPGSNDTAENLTLTAIKPAADDDSKEPSEGEDIYISIMPSHHASCFLTLQSVAVVAIILLTHL